MSRPLQGTLVSVALEPARLMVRAEGQFQEFDVAAGAAVERRPFSEAGTAPPARIALSDLTPGEYVDLEIDGAGRVARVGAVAVIERARARSVEGPTVVLDDGTTLTVSTVLRYVDSEGKASQTVTLKPGEGVLLFRHPVTRNLYRFSPEPRAR